MTDWTERAVHEMTARPRQVRLCTELSSIVPCRLDSRILASSLRASSTAFFLTYR